MLVYCIRPGCIVQFLRSLRRCCAEGVKGIYRTSQLLRRKVSRTLCPGAYQMREKEWVKRELGKAPRLGSNRTRKFALRLQTNDLSWFSTRMESSSPVRSLALTVTFVKVEESVFSRRCDHECTGQQCTMWKSPTFGKAHGDRRDAASQFQLHGRRHGDRIILILPISLHNLFSNMCVKRGNIFVDNNFIPSEHLICLS